jgi:hypothetical protein
VDKGCSVCSKDSSSSIFRIYNILEFHFLARKILSKHVLGKVWKSYLDEVFQSRSWRLLEQVFCQW